MALSLVVPLEDQFTIVPDAEFINTIPKEVKVDGAMEDTNAAPAIKWLDSMKRGLFFYHFLLFFNS